VSVDGQRLRQLRAERGLSQEKLAYSLDLGLTTIRNLECGPRGACREWTLDLIASALGTDPASLAPADVPPAVAKPPGNAPENAPGENVVAIKAATSRRRRGAG
jgi:transcriptional regulator with XRE-family HTH domain